MVKGGGSLAVFLSAMLLFVYIKRACSRHVRCVGGWVTGGSREKKIDQKMTLAREYFT